MDVSGTDRVLVRFRNTGPSHKVPFISQMMLCSFLRHLLSVNRMPDCPE